jgi:hypothetical protein
MFIIPQGGYDQHGVARQLPNFGNDTQYYPGRGMWRGDVFITPELSPEMFGQQPAAPQQPSRQAPASAAAPDMSAYSASRAQPRTQSYGTPYAPTVTQSAWQTPPMTFGGGGLGNYANMAPDMRPPGFTASYSDPFGGMSSVPNYGQRDAFIQQLNDRTGQYQQGNLQGMPSFDFGSMWSNAGQMAQSGWQNPFAMNRALPSVQPAPPPSRQDTQRQALQQMRDSRPARVAAQTERRNASRAAQQARRASSPAAMRRAEKQQAMEEMRAAYPGVPPQKLMQAYNLSQRAARSDNPARFDELLARLSPRGQASWRQGRPSIDARRQQEAQASMFG